MATKRECDRCKKQWTAETEEDQLTATIRFYIPATKSTRTISGWEENPEINEEKDYCQGCARVIFDHANPTEAESK